MMMNVMEPGTETLSTETTLLERARALRPLVEASADQIERERQLPEPLVEAIAAAGTSAIVEGSPLNRRLRDVLVAGQNVAVSPMDFGAAGQMLLGAGT